MVTKHTVKNPTNKTAPKGVFNKINNNSKENSGHSIFFLTGSIVSISIS